MSRARRPVLALMLHGLLIVGMCIAARPAQAQAPASNQPLGCLIEPERTAEVGTPLIGVIDAVLVDRGEAVRKGQVLASLRSEVEQANVESARMRATAEGEIQAAVANRDVARLKFKRTYELVKLGGAGQLELEQAKGEYEVADQRLVQARDGQKVAERELASAEAQLRQRTVRSPFDAVIVDRLIQPGERVDGKPMFRLAALNPLRVEVIVPAVYYGQLQQGMSIPVQPDFAGAGTMNAQVVQVDQLVDAASGTFRARLSLPNPRREVPAGVRCKVSLNKLPGQAPGAARPEPPRARQ